MGDNINILNELKELNSTVLINAERKNLYAYPDGYFYELSANIVRQIWFQSLPFLNPYSVPEGYFENLPEIILDKLAVKSNYSHAVTKTLYNVPHGYFNNLAGNILQKIKSKNNTVQEELEEIAPLLSTIPKTNVFTVPARYFETLAPVQTKLSEQPVKVISIGTKARRWIAYAAAACIAAFMFGGGYYYMQGKAPANTSAIHTEIAGVNIEQAISQLSDSDIDDYLNNDNSDVYTNQNFDNQDLNIKTLIENMSDEEIDNYLLKNAEPGESKKGI